MFIITKQYKVTACKNCPNYSNTMDGMTCNEEEKKGAYRGMIINNNNIISPKCPLNKK